MTNMKDTAKAAKKSLETTAKAAKKSLETLKRTSPDLDVEKMQQAMVKWGKHTVCNIREDE